MQTPDAANEFPQKAATANRDGESRGANLTEGLGAPSRSNAPATSAALALDLDAYCIRCGSDQFTELDPKKHPSMRWCSLCWDWQKPIPSNLRALIEAKS